MMFIMTLNWTEQGIKNVKDAPKRAKAARELGKKMGVQIKQLFLTFPALHNGPGRHCGVKGRRPRPGGLCNGARLVRSLR